MTSEAIRFHPDNTIPKGAWIWVFGSNLAGRHGAGAAKVAHVNFRAEYGVGEGVTGSSYAIPTKGRHLEVLSLDAIASSIGQFLDYAAANPSLNFYLTRVGCGRAGFSDEQIAPLFSARPLPNISYPEEWGTYFAISAKPRPSSIRP